MIHHEIERYWDDQRIANGYDFVYTPPYRSLDAVGD